MEFRSLALNPKRHRWILKSPRGRFATEVLPRTDTGIHYFASLGAARVVDEQGNLPLSHHVLFRACSPVNKTTIHQILLLLPLHSIHMNAGGGY